MGFRSSLIGILTALPPAVAAQKRHKAARVQRSLGCPALAFHDAQQLLMLRSSHRNHEPPAFGQLIDQRLEELRAQQRSPESRRKAPTRANPRSHRLPPRSHSHNPCAPGAPAPKPPAPAAFPPRSLPWRAAKARLPDSRSRIRLREGARAPRAKAHRPSPPP